MFLKKWNAVFAPETGTGQEQADSGAPPTGSEGTEDNRRIGGRSELRKQLEKSFDAARKTSDQDRGDGRSPEGKFVRGGKASREQTEETETEDTVEAGQAEGQDQTADETQVATEATEGTETEPEQPQAGPAPEGWSKEAKAAWAKLPAEVQAAVKKREVDTTKGVNDLKAKYNEMDKALQPHMETLRRHNRAPAEAVGQLFAWFAALANNPQTAFPALAKSFGRDLKEFVEQPAAGSKETTEAGKATQEGQQQPTGEIPTALQQFIDAQSKQIEGLRSELSQKMGFLESTFAESSAQKAKETLNVWAKDKPHFEAVRGIMAELIGKGLVPLKEGNQVDLDAAYDKALYYDPTIRETVLAEKEKTAAEARQKKQEAERKAQQERADKARRANLSLGPSSPGAGNTAGKPQGRQGKTVRDSINEALEAHRS